MHVATIVGARPQFIKAAAVSRALRAADGVRETLIHTGQHYDAGMSDIFFTELEIPKPEYHLGIGSLPHGAQTGRMLEAVEGVLSREEPDWVLVYGDTNSTLAGALAAVKLHVPLAHVEAGLRSFNRRMPEEINRVLTDHASDLLFAPTATALEQLQREGIDDEKIRLVGDVMYDAALFYGDRARAQSGILKRLGLRDKAYRLATVHRAENTDDPARLAVIAEALAAAARTEPVVLPLHPRTEAALARAGLLGRLRANVTVTEPLGYLDMIMLEQHASLILTDSGGVQKEAFFFGVPCVTLRAETEWTELVEAGWNTLAPPSSAAALEQVIEEVAANPPADPPLTLYGSGQSAPEIVRALGSR